MISLLFHWLLGTSFVAIMLLLRFPRLRKPVAWIVVLTILHYA